MSKTTDTRQAGAYASILLGAALWGILGLWTRGLMAGGLSSYSVALIRNLGGMLMLLAIFGIKDRQVFHVKKEHLKYFFSSGIISVLLFSACYFSCQRICSLAVASVLLYTAPAFVVVMSAILWKEPFTKRKAAALLLTLLGCCMVCGVFAGDLTVTLPGFLLGLGAGFFYALYTIFGRYALNHYDSITVIVWTFIFAGIGSLVFLRPAEMAAALVQPKMCLQMLGLVGVSTVLPYIFYTRGLSRIEAGKASIMASLEPVVASLTGVLLFGEPLGILTVGGVLCVLAGVYILR